MSHDPDPDPEFERFLEEIEEKFPQFAVYEDADGFADQLHALIRYVFEQGGLHAAAKSDEACSKASTHQKERRERCRTVGFGPNVVAEFEGTSPKARYRMVLDRGRSGLDLGCIVEILRADAMGEPTWKPIPTGTEFATTSRERVIFLLALQLGKLTPKEPSS